MGLKLKHYMRWCLFELTYSTDKSISGKNLIKRLISGLNAQKMKHPLEGCLTHEIKTSSFRSSITFV